MKFKLKILTGYILIACYPFAVINANPSGGTVANGSASFNQQGKTLNITNSPGTIINWQNFSISEDEKTKFIQQSVDSAVLNRVTSQNPSDILGSLQSNGRVFIINPNGISFGANSIVDVGGLVASTLNLSNEDFLSQQLNFNGDGTNGGVSAQGEIITPEGGFVYLIAPNVENHGVITSPKGEVILAAGHSVQLIHSDNPDIRVTLTAPEGEVVNVGDIITRGGKTSIYAGLINQQGTINADSAVVGENGKIFFKASTRTTLSSSSITTANGVEGGSVKIETTQGLTEVSGKVSAVGENGKGGEILILGEHVGILDNAIVDASGTTGGGTVLIGGDNKGENNAVKNAKATYVGVNTKIHADAINEGNGGKVILWSDDATRAYGTITAKGGAVFGDGGFVETSGGYLDVAGLNLDVTATNGEGGTWLLDPYNITISGTTTVSVTGSPNYTPTATGSNILNTDINAQLDAGTSVIVDTTGAGSEAGNITVDAAISKSTGGAATLTLKAHNNIITNAAISSTSGALNVVLTADQDSNGVGSVTLNGTLNSLNGNVTISAAGDITFNSGSNNTIDAGTGTVTLTSGGWIHGNPMGAPTDVIANSVVFNGTNGIFSNSGSAQFVTNATNVSFTNSGSGLVRIKNLNHVTFTGSNNNGNIILETAFANTATINNITASNGYISFNTYAIDITGSVNAGSNSVYLSPIGNDPFSINGSSIFDISNTEIANISAGTIYLGQDTFGNYAGSLSIASASAVNIGAKKLRVTSNNDIIFGANNFTATGGDIGFKSITGKVTTGTGLISSDIVVLEGAGLMSIGNGGITATNYAGLNGGDIFISGTVTSPIFYLSVFNSDSTISIGGNQTFNIAQADIDFIKSDITYIGNNPYVANTNNVKIATSSTIDFGARNIEVKSHNGILTGTQALKATGGNLKLISSNAGADITTGAGNVAANSVTMQSGRDIVVNSGGINAVNSITLTANNTVSQKGNLTANGTGTITVKATNQDITMAAGTKTTGGNGDIIYKAGNNITLAMLDSGLADTTINAGAAILDNNGNGVNNIIAKNLTVSSADDASLDYQISNTLNASGVVGVANLRVYPTISSSTNEALTTTINTISDTTNSLSTNLSLTSTSTSTAPLPVESDTTSEVTTASSEEASTSEDNKEEEQSESTENKNDKKTTLASKKLPICK